MWPITTPDAHVQSYVSKANLLGRNRCLDMCLKAQHAVNKLFKDTGTFTTHKARLDKAHLR